MSEDMERYEQLLQDLDWYYDYTDDGVVWRRGRAQFEEANKLRIKLDQQGIAATAMWNAAAPETRYHKVAE